MGQRIETSPIGASVSLFHGQGAQDAAMEAAGQYGRVLAVLGGDKGLRKDDSREMLRFHNMPPASDAFGSVVLGPMDLATFEAADALLKIIEEPSAYTRPFLWAFDLGEVPKTIRSRCQPIWSSGPASTSSEEINSELIESALAGDGIAIGELLVKHDPKTVLDAALKQLSKREGEPRTWAHMKNALGRESIASVSAALANAGAGK